MSTRHFQRVRKKLREAAHTDFNCSGNSVAAQNAIADLNYIETLGQQLLESIRRDHKGKDDALIRKEAERVFGRKK